MSWPFMVPQGSAIAGMSQLHWMFGFSYSKNAVRCPWTVDSVRGPWTQDAVVPLGSEGKWMRPVYDERKSRASTFI